MAAIASVPSPIPSPSIRTSPCASVGISVGITPCPLASAGISDTGDTAIDSSSLSSESIEISTEESIVIADTEEFSAAESSADSLSDCDISELSSEISAPTKFS